MLLADCEGKPYEFRRRYAMLIPILRGHKMSMETMREMPTGAVGQCEVCDQIVKADRDGSTVTGRAVENDCPAAEWKR